MAKYYFNYWFEWGCSEEYCLCLWAVDDYTRKTFNCDCGVAETDIRKLPLSEELVKFLYQLGIEHDKALDWECPTNPLVWTKEEEDAFYQKAKEGYKRIVEELGNDYSIKYCEPR